MSEAVQVWVVVAALPIVGFLVGYFVIGPRAYRSKKWRRWLSGKGTGRNGG